MTRRLIRARRSLAPPQGAACALRLTLGLAAGAPLASGAAAVDFDREVAPILAARCVGCHRPDKTKGGYQLHTLGALMKPGRSREAPIVAGRPEASLLVRLIESTDSEERMPQDGEPLAAGEIRLIRRWIQDGAKLGSRPPETLLSSLAAEATPQPAPPERYPRPVPIHALAFSPDGNTIAAGGYHEVTTWDAETGALRRRIQNVARQVQQIRYSPDGRVLAIAAGTPGRLGEVKLFDSADGKWIRTLATAGDLMLTVAFSPDGKRVAVGGADNAVVLLDAGSGAVAFRAELNADWVMQVSFSHDGQRLVVASRDKTVRIVSVATGELEETYAQHAEPVFAAAFTPEDARIMSGGRDRTLHLWQASDGKKLGESPPVSAEVLRLEPAGEALFLGLANGEILEHHFDGKKLTFRRTIGRHGNALGALAVHGDSGKLASAGYDGLIRIWDGETGELKISFSATPGWTDAAATALKTTGQRNGK